MLTTRASDNGNHWKSLKTYECLAKYFPKAWPGVLTYRFTFLCCFNQHPSFVISFPFQALPSVILEGSSAVDRSSWFFCIWECLGSSFISEGHLHWRICSCLTNTVLLLSGLCRFFLFIYLHIVKAFISGISQLDSVSVQFSSVTQSCPTLCDPMNRNTPGLPVHHQLLEFTQTHVHRVGDAIQLSHPLSSPSPPAPNPSQHQSLFQWVNSSHEVAKVLELQL